MIVRRIKLVTAMSVALSTSIVAVPDAADAHRSGCHRWHSCPSDSGSYVCGDLGYTSECGGTTEAAPVVEYAAPTPIITPKPRVPVIKTAIVDELSQVAPPATLQKELKTEYRDFKHIVQVGAMGSSKKVFKVTYADGIETNRIFDHEEIVSPAVQEVIEVGTLSRPKAIWDSIRTSDKSWFEGKSSSTKYDISGSTGSSKKLALKVDGREVATTKAINGRFMFRKVTLRQGTHVSVYEISGWTTGSVRTKISETATLQKDMISYTTQYLESHKLTPFQLKKG